MQEQQSNRLKPQVIFLDVYETLLDMSDVERKVNSLLESSKGYALWFDLFMQYCFVDNSTNQFNDFPSIAKATMQMTAQKLGRTVDGGDLDFVMELLTHLPVHEHVQEGLSQLNDLGYRMAALTNSPERVVFDRMERTGLVSYFETVLSAERVKKYKPCAEVYNWAAQKLGVANNQCLMVSSHGWDIAGADNAGLQTCYLNRGKEMLYPLAPKPDFAITSLEQLPNALASLV